MKNLDEQNSRPLASLISRFFGLEQVYDPLARTHKPYAVLETRNGTPLMLGEFDLLTLVDSHSNMAALSGTPKNPECANALAAQFGLAIQAAIDVQRASGPSAAHQVLASPSFPPAIEAQAAKVWHTIAGTPLRKTLPTGYAPRPGHV